MLKTAQKVNSETTEDLCSLCAIKAAAAPKTPAKSSDESEKKCPAPPKRPPPETRHTKSTSRKRLMDEYPVPSSSSSSAPAAAAASGSSQVLEDGSLDQADQEIHDVVATMGTQELDQKHRELEELSKDTEKKRDEVDRKRVRHEDELDENPPLTQRYFSSSRYGPTRVSDARRMQLEVEHESWRVVHGSRSEIIYSRPSQELANKYKSEHLIVLERCRICNNNCANTVNVNCGHAVYCIVCASERVPLKCHICDTSISRIIPILNPMFYTK